MHFCRPSSTRPFPGLRKPIVLSGYMKIMLRRTRHVRNRPLSPVGSALGSRSVITTTSATISLETYMLPSRSSASTERARPAARPTSWHCRPDDRRLRFGSSLSAESDRGVRRSNRFRPGRGFRRPRRQSRCSSASPTLRSLDEHAELGLSVLPDHRGRGVGSALFERGAAHARNRSCRSSSCTACARTPPSSTSRSSSGCTSSPRRAKRMRISSSRRRPPVDRRRIRDRPARALRLRAQGACRGVERRRHGAPPEASRRDPLRCGFRPSAADPGGETMLGQLQ